MIVYYKYCPMCYELLPSGPMIVRDTDATQNMVFNGEYTCLMPGDTLSVFCERCVKNT